MAVIPFRKRRGQLRRYLPFAARALEANFRDLEQPYRLFVHVTNACNARCTMCGIWRKPVGDELSTHELLDVLGNAARYIQWMDITGGEVFLREDIFDILQFVADGMPRMAMFHFATNGLLTERVVRGAEIVARSRIPRFIVTVSLDGPPELHDRMRGVNGCWERSVETFRALRASGVDVVFGMTLTEQNVACFDATLDAVVARVPGVVARDFHVNLAQVSELYYGNRGEIAPAGPSLLDALAWIHRKRGPGFGVVDYLERAYLAHARTYVETGRSPMLCEALSSSAVLGPQGDVYPCIIFDRSIGNVREAGYDLERLWGRPIRKRLREEIRRGKCPHCWTPCEAYQAIIANTLVPGSVWLWQASLPRRSGEGPTGKV